MKISTKGRYAVRIMIDIARHSGETVPLKDVSDRQNISLKYAEQIVNALSKAGCLRSKRGAMGGYMLTHSPEEYNVGDILRAAEGSLAPVECLEGDKNMCLRADKCSALRLWEGLYKVINEYLDSVTIAELMDFDAECN